jgi:hypothetical protein
MQAYVTSVNELLDQRAKDDPMTVADMLDMLALEFTSATRVSSFNLSLLQLSFRPAQDHLYLRAALPRVHERPLPPSPR